MNTSPEPAVLPPAVPTPEDRIPGAIYLSSSYEGLLPLPPGGWGVQIITGPPAFLGSGKKRPAF